MKIVGGSGERYSNSRKGKGRHIGVKNVVVATNSGATANLVHEVFGADYLIIAVGNPASAHERSLVRHSGVSEATRKSLEQKGIRAVLEDQSLFQAMDFGGQCFDIGGKSFGVWGHCFHMASLQEVIENASSEGDFNAVAIIYNTLQMFGDGPRVCFEVALMAADSGVLPLDADCISIARPREASNCPHAAMVLRPAKKEDIFMKALRIKDLVLVPGPKDHWFDNGPLWVG